MGRLGYAPFEFKSLEVILPLVTSAQPSLLVFRFGLLRTALPSFGLCCYFHFDLGPYSPLFAADLPKLAVPNPYDIVRFE